MNRVVSLSSIAVLLSVMAIVTSSLVQQVPIDSTLDETIQQSSKKVWIVLEGESEEPSLKAEKVAELFRGLFNVLYVKSESGSSSMKIYKDDRSNPITFDGNVEEQDLESIVDFVLSNVDELIEARSEVAKALKANQEFQQKERERAKKEWEDEQELRKKSDTIVLDISNWNLLANGREPWIVNFYEANNSACISLNRDWEYIATEFKGQAKIAKINITEPGNEVLEEQIRLEKYPSVRFYKSGPKKINEFEQFEGVHKKFSLQEWVREKLNQKEESVEIPRLNAENYQTLCKGTKNTCVIVFMENQDSESLKKIEELSAKYLKKPISFLISKKGEQDKFAEQAEVASYPDTVMMYCKLKKLYRMEGLDFNAIDETINEISLGNRNGFVRYNFVEELQ